MRNVLGFSRQEIFEGDGGIPCYLLFGALHFSGARDKMVEVSLLLDFQKPALRVRTENVCEGIVS
jgi:hypothetical protein